MKYKLKLLLRGDQQLDDSRDIGTREYDTPAEVEIMVKEMFDKHKYVIVARRELKGWGAELFFKDVTPNPQYDEQL